VQIGLQNRLTPLPRCAEDLITVTPRPRIDRQALQAPPRRDLSGAPVALAVENLVARADRHTLLDRVNFELRRGECLAVVGANGAGKTTLLRHLMGLARPAAGRIRLHGQDITGRSVAQLAREVGLAFQNPDNQFFKLSVEEEIACGPRALGREDPAWLADLVARFGLAPYRARAPYRLSGGEKKRVAFASALAARPSVLALDEPTAGQDAHFRRALAELLAILMAEGLSVIVVTHDLNFAARCADRWLLMAEGRVLADAPPWAVMADAPAMALAGLAPTEAFKLREALREGGRNV
jgi:energy-coupling factor transport system ATP-binding protein